MSILVSTVVDETYSWYAPLFIFCLRKAYPEYDIRIFTHGKWSKEVKNALQFVDGYELIPGLFDGWPKTKYEPICWRFLVPPEYYKDYTYIYIGDIDIMILREKIEIMDFHINEMNETGFNYSNSLRTRKSWKGRESFTGLHFCNYEWFERTEAQRKYFENLVKTGKLGQKREFDGHLLYLLTFNSNLHIVKKYPNLKKRHHGIHLGTLRLYHKHSDLVARIDPDKCRKWLVIRNDPIFKEILKLVSVNEMVSSQIQQLDSFCRKVL
jgi:hypothetical protein